MTQPIHERKLKAESNLRFVELYYLVNTVKVRLMNVLSVKAYGIVVQDFFPLARNITRFSNGFHLKVFYTAYCIELIQDYLYFLFPLRVVLLRTLRYGHYKSLKQFLLIKELTRNETIKSQMISLTN